MEFGHFHDFDSDDDDLELDFDALATSFIAGTVSSAARQSLFNLVSGSSSSVPNCRNSSSHSTHSSELSFSDKACSITATKGQDDSFDEDDEYDVCIRKANSRWSRFYANGDYTERRLIPVVSVSQPKYSKHEPSFSPLSVTLKSSMKFCPERSCVSSRTSSVACVNVSNAIFYSSVTASSSSGKVVDSGSKSVFDKNDKSQNVFQLMNPSVSESDEESLSSDESDSDSADLEDCDKVDAGVVSESVSSSYSRSNNKPAVSKAKNSASYKDEVGVCKTVRLNRCVQTRVLSTWLLANKLARDGKCYTRAAVDRTRFYNRIFNLGRTISPILQTDHRLRIWMARFIEPDQ